MTARYYFDLRKGSDTLHDDVGVEASGLDEVTREARTALDELRGSGEAPGLRDGWELVIRDKSGMTLQAISLG